MKRLISKRIWAHCSNKSVKLKAPAVGLGRTKPISYEQAISNAEKQISGSPYMGMIFGDTSEYIGFDIDVDPSGKKKNSTKQIPPEVLFFLQSHPTHVHYSPSGHGIHIIYKVSKATVKQLDEINLQQQAVDTETGDLFKGDIRYRKSFLVFTTNEHPLSVKTITTLDYNDILSIVPSIVMASQTKKVTTTVTPSTITQVPTLTQLKEVLDVIPSVFNAKAKRACQNLPYSKPASAYDYWVLIGCACAHHAILLDACGRSTDSKNVVDYFHDWSKHDVEGYINQEDVYDKYQLLHRATVEKIQAQQQTTTIGSLFLIAKGCIINFPDMISYGKNKIRPDPVSTRNLLTLIEYDQIELVFDPMAGGVCFYGPEELITEWFCPAIGYLAMRPAGYSQVASISDMAIRFRPYMQNRYAYSVSSQHAREAIDFLCQRMRRENAFKSWILSKPWDGIERFSKVCRSITLPDADQPNKEVYEGYIKRGLLSMIGIHFWPEDAPKIPAMIVLTGPEYTFKSSWAEWLIPKHMGNYIATADIDTVLTAGREWQMFLSTKAVVVINECEPMFTPRHEQKVKSSVDSETVTYRDPYAKHVLSRPRTALIIGTTNKANLFTGSTGTRKIWQIPVAECDSMLIKNMDLQQLYIEVLEVLKTYKQEHPRHFIQIAWAQSERDRDITNTLNAARKGTDIGVLGLLIERFGHFLNREFTPSEYIGKRGVSLRPGQPGSLKNSPNAWTVSAMLKYLRYEFPEDRVDRVSVKYALEEYAAAYTKTTHKPKSPFDQYVATERYHKTITRGFITLSKTTGYYLMPSPVELDMDVENEDEDDEPQSATIDLI